MSLCVWCEEEGGRAERWAGNGHVPVMLPLSLSAMLGVSRAINLCMQCIKFKLKEPPSRILPATSTRFDTLQHWLGSACSRSTVHSPQSDSGSCSPQGQRQTALSLSEPTTESEGESERELTPPALSATSYPSPSLYLSLCLWHNERHQMLPQQPSSGL